MSASLRFAVDWIASEDNPGSGDSEAAIAGYLTTALVADLFCKEPSDIARRVAKVRREAGLAVGDDE